MADQNDTTTNETTTQTAPTPELGDAGRKALDTEREARKAAEQRAKDLEERLAQIERDQARSKVAAERGLTADQAKFLTGATEEEMTAQADELTAAFSPEPSTRRRPAEKLTPGAAPMAEATDYASIADRVVRGR